MKILYYYKIMVTILFLNSCNNVANKNEIKAEQDTTAIIEKYLTDSVSIEKELIEKIRLDRIKSDTLKKIKAFDDIYFRTNNAHFKKEYLIDNIPFQVTSSTYSKDLLYDFELRTKYLPGIDYEYKNKTLKRFISIIKIKYNDPKKINIFFQSEPVDGIVPDDETNLPKPNDNDNLHIQYEWIKDDVRVRLGYKIIYEKSEKYSQNYGYYRKMFVPVLQFRDLKIAKESNKENKKSEKQEIKNEGEKF